MEILYSVFRQFHVIFCRFHTVTKQLIFESRFFLFQHCAHILFMISRKKIISMTSVETDSILPPKISFVAYFHPISTLCTHFFLISRKKNHQCDKCEERFNLTPQDVLCCVFSYHFHTLYTFYSDFTKKIIVTSVKKHSILLPKMIFVAYFHHSMIKYATNLKIKNILVAYLVRIFPVA